MISAHPRSVKWPDLLALEQGVDVFLVEVIPGAGQAVDKHGHDAEDDIEDNPADSDLILDLPDLGLDQIFNRFSKEPVRSSPASRIRAGARRRDRSG